MLTTKTKRSTKVALLLAASALGLMAASPVSAHQGQQGGSEGSGAVAGNTVDVPVRGSSDIDINCNNGILGTGIAANVGSTCGEDKKSSSGYDSTPGTPRQESPSPTPPVKSEGGLPVTGSSVGFIIGGGAVLLLGGGVLFVMARRRRRTFVV